MPYVDDSTRNGKKRGGVAPLLGEVAFDFVGRQFSGLGASAFTVLRNRLLAQTAAQTAVAPPPPAPVPLINVVRLPTGTAVPAPVMPVLLPAPAPTYAAPAPTPTYGMPTITGSPADPYSSRGGMGPPPNYPAPIVGTLPYDDGDSNIQTAGVGSLAGLTSNPLVLGLIAVAAFVMLDGSTPKRKRRR